MIEKVQDKPLEAEFFADWPVEADGGRHFGRWQPFAAILRKDGADVRTLVDDISPTGVRLVLRAATALQMGDVVELDIDGYGDLEAKVARIEDREVALLFTFEAREAAMFRKWLNTLRIDKLAVNIDEG